MGHAGGGNVLKNALRRGGMLLQNYRRQGSLTSANQHPSTWPWPCPAGVPGSGFPGLKVMGGGRGSELGAFVP
jgi:hypothetical protein